MLHSINLIQGFEGGTIMLLGETKFYINDALYSTRSRRNLLNC